MAGRSLDRHQDLRQGRRPGVAATAQRLRRHPPHGRALADAGQGLDQRQGTQPGRNGQLRATPEPGRIRFSTPGCSSSASRQSRRHRRARTQVPVRVRSRAPARASPRARRPARAEPGSPGRTRWPIPPGPSVAPFAALPIPFPRTKGGDVQCRICRCAAPPREEPGSRDRAPSGWCHNANRMPVLRGRHSCVRSRRRSITARQRLAWRPDSEGPPAT